MSFYRKRSYFLMKKIIVIVIICGLIGVISQAYFWENFGRPMTQEEIDKRALDLKYQEKQSRMQQKKAEVAAHAQKRQKDLSYEQSRLELKRKQDRLKLER